MNLSSEICNRTVYKHFLQSTCRSDRDCPRTFSSRVGRCKESRNALCDIGNFFRSSRNKNNCSYRTCVQCFKDVDCRGDRYCSNGSCYSRSSSRSSSNNNNGFNSRKTTTTSPYDDTLCNHGHSALCSPHQAALKNSLNTGINTGISTGIGIGASSHNSILCILSWTHTALCG